jgi:hypothetical protein
MGYTTKADGTKVIKGDGTARTVAIDAVGFLDEFKGTPRK